MAAPKPATPKAATGFKPASMEKQARHLMPLATIITRCLGQWSAHAPTQGPNTTYDKVNMSLSSGIQKACCCCSIKAAMATTSKALSARADTNCAAKRMKKPGANG